MAEPVKDPDVANLWHTDLGDFYARDGQTIDEIKSDLVEIAKNEDVPALSATAVDEERERRIGLPLEVTLPSGTFIINMDALALRNLQGLSSMGMYLEKAAPDQIIPFRDYFNQTHNLTPADLIDMGVQVATRIQTMYAKSWVIKAKAITKGFTDDAYWS